MYIQIRVVIRVSGMLLMINANIMRVETFVKSVGFSKFKIILDYTSLHFVVYLYYIVHIYYND